MINSVVIETLPRLPTTHRTRCELRPRKGMKSISTASPSAVTKLVSRISVLGLYRRVVRGFPCAGAISHRPLLVSPRSAAKHASESNRGQHSQSIEPVLHTSAAVSQSPISP
jgi:hypothetical protein